MEFGLCTGVIGGTPRELRGATLYTIEAIAHWKLVEAAAANADACITKRRERQLTPQHQQHQQQHQHQHQQQHQQHGRRLLQVDEAAPKDVRGSTTFDVYLEVVVPPPRVQGKERR